MADVSGLSPYGCIYYHHTDLTRRYLTVVAAYCFCSTSELASSLSHSLTDVQQNFAIENA